MSEENGKTCEYGICNRPLHDEKHCIFHSVDIEWKKGQFKEAFWEEFDRQKKKEEENYDFNGFVFPEVISFYGKQFDKDADFGDAQFSMKAIFYRTHFSGVADFYCAQFNEDVDFFKAKFSEWANFSEAKFYRKVSFSLARFSNEVDFNGVQFNGDSNFTATQFSEKAFFKNAEFNGKSYFHSMEFNDFNQCDMTDTYFYNVSGFLEYLAENKKEFKHPRGIKYLHEGCKPILGEDTVSRLPLLSREIKDDIYLMSFKEKHPRLHFLWWLFADCGRSIWRWALWSVFFALYFALNFYLIDYSLTGAFAFNEAIQSGPIVSFIYYSVVTFTTLGFGDITPGIEVAQWWVVGEVIMGYLMLGGLISILANKLARRS
jgi:hypothetical protein